MQGITQSNQTSRRMDPKVQIAAVVTVALTAIFTVAARPLGLSPGKTLLGGVAILGTGFATMAGIDKWEEFKAKAAISMFF